MRTFVVLAGFVIATGIYLRFVAWIFLFKVYGCGWGPDAPCGTPDPLTLVLAIAGTVLIYAAGCFVAWKIWRNRL